MMRYLFVFLLSALCLIGCSEDTQPTMYTLTVTANPAEGGTINPAGGEFEEGTEVTIRVSPNTYYEFDKWSGNWNGVENPLTLTMDGNITLIGNFALSDSDNDGLTDDIDSCPNTPVGQTIDSNGCSSSQKDTDGDGVMDDMDTCADTVEFEEVDENGCSDSQKDTDGDGVTDDIDICSDTPSGEVADENGCSDSQKDTDNDGVTDDIDICSDTPSGEVADENGCSDSQRDTDNDGVTDDIDECPNTPIGIIVNSDGCGNRGDLLKGTSWALAPIEGALKVGPNADAVWWQSSVDDITTRACLFDDLYIFNADGTYSQEMQDQTWLEGVHGAQPEGCGDLVAPWDGSNPATWYSDNSTITIIGDGAFLGLARVHNTGEDGRPADDTIVYNYVLDGANLTITIQGFLPDVPEATWTFKFRRQ